jgi:hypothetical protein
MGLFTGLGPVGSHETSGVIDPAERAQLPFAFSCSCRKPTRLRGSSRTGSRSFERMPILEAARIEWRPSPRGRGRSGVHRRAVPVTQPVAGHASHHVDPALIGGRPPQVHQPDGMVEVGQRLRQLARMHSDHRPDGQQVALPRRAAPAELDSIQQSERPRCPRLATSRWPSWSARRRPPLRETLGRLHRLLPRQQDPR